MPKGVVIFIILAAAVILPLCTGLKGPPGSVCIHHTSRRASRIESYYEPHKVGWWLSRRTQYRTKYQRVWFTVWDQREKCCSGYRNKSSVCEPICDQGCTNGRCVGPNKCECNSGYSFGSDGSACEAFRKNPCTFGRCIAPKTCTCKEGYKWKPTDNSCEPICVSACEHGWCDTPNQCACDAGYTLNDNNQCTVVCKSGFLYNETTRNCDPVCGEECINGVCAGPDTCECLEGYSKSLDNSSICTINCEDCANGSCVKPNECECNEGFFKDDAENGSCIPECDSGCIHGRCTALGCVCSFGWEGKSCDQPKFCVVVTPTENSAEDHHESNGYTPVPESADASTGDTIYSDVTDITHISSTDPDDSSSSEHSADTTINISETLSTDASEMTATESTAISTLPCDMETVIEYSETKWDGPSCSQIASGEISGTSVYMKWIGPNETQHFFVIAHHRAMNCCRSSSPEYFNRGKLVRG